MIVQAPGVGGDAPARRVCERGLQVMRLGIVEADDQQGTHARQDFSEVAAPRLAIRPRHPVHRAVHAAADPAQVGVKRGRGLRGGDSDQIEAQFKRPFAQQRAREGHLNRGPLDRSW